MPVDVSRKIEFYLRDKHPEADVRLIQLALNEAQL